MEQQTYGIKLAKKLFWWANLSCLALTSIYCFVTHQNPLDSFLLDFSIGLCIPYAFIKAEEYKDKVMGGMHGEFSQLSDRELLDVYKKSQTLPAGKQKAMYKGMLERELERRFGAAEV